MPRQPRLDTPGALHHVMGRGIDGIEIFGDIEDRKDFLERLKNLSDLKAFCIYAWALMNNHFHLLVKTGNTSLSNSMRKLLTGYVVKYKRRHKRYGHLFQYEWCGHSVIMGSVKREWQDKDTVLAYFGKRRKTAVEKYT